jgi:hypothetical protein
MTAAARGCRSEVGVNGAAADVCGSSDAGASAYSAETSPAAQENTLAADRRASNPNWEPGPSRRAAGSWPKESRRAGHRYRIGSLPRSTRCGLPFALKPVGYLLHASRGLDLADPLAWPGGRGERHRKRCRRGPLLRRGRDSNPRWTVRPTTVFETRMCRGGIPLWERVCGLSKRGALHNALH